LGGSVKIHVTIPDFSVDVTFTHLFEIYQYKGTLSYTNTDSGADASVAFARVDASGQTISGPLTLILTNSASLGYPAGTWTSSGGSLVFGNSADYGVQIGTDAIPTHYTGSVVFQDGMPGAPAPGQYQLWRLDIFDPNDSNKNGIPDLSDRSGATTVTAALAVAVQNGSLQFTVSSKAGQQITIEQTSDLANPAWQPATNLTLSSDVQTVTLDLPTGPQVFYRAR
jgi:hypothetical protein